MKMKKSMMLLVMLVMVLQTKLTKSQDIDCPRALGNLNVCAPSVLPGQPGGTPPAECCSALQAVPHDCVCNTMRIASQLPSACNLPAISCGTN